MLINGKDWDVYLAFITLFILNRQLGKLQVIIIQPVYIIEVTKDVLLLDIIKQIFYWLV